VPVTAILFILVCNLGSHTNKNVASKFTRACASASNRDKDLTLTLKRDHPESWYIEVGLRDIVVDVETPYVAAMHEEEISVATAAYPVAAAVSSSCKILYC
jgi:hypothetical protein